MIPALCFLALAALAAAEEPGYGSGFPHGGGYGGHGSYQRSKPFYGGHHRTSYRAPYPVAGHSYTNEEYEQLDALDKLYQRLDTVQDELKTGSQLLANLEARLSLSKGFLEEIVTVTIPDMTVEDSNIDNVLSDLDADQADLATQLGPLGAAVATQAQRAEAQLAQQRNLDEEVLDLRVDDTGLDAGIQEAVYNVNGIKPDFLQNLGNTLDIIEYNTNLMDFVADILNERENARFCETGQVTLDADDRKAEYLFQSSFDSVPQVLYALCGYNFDLENRPNNYDYYYKEPNAMGLLVTAEASRTGLTVEVFDQSFGDTALLSADVCFQVCSIGPDTSVMPPVHMMDMPEMPADEGALPPP